MRNKNDFGADYYQKKVWYMENKVVRDGAKEITKTVKYYLKKDPKALTLLDVGCGEGEFPIALAKYFKSTIGLEPFKNAYLHAKKLLPNNIENVKFVNKKIEDYNPKQQFDVITAITIYEHLADQKAAFDQMFKLLKKGGFMYVTAPNKYWIFETHYGLPFLGWLPLFLANIYLQMFTKAKSYEDSSYSRSYMYMKNFFDQYDCIYEFILPFDTEGSFIGCGRKGYYSLIKKIGIKLIKLHPIFWNISKGFIVVLRKK